MVATSNQVKAQSTISICLYFFFINSGKCGVVESDVFPQMIEHRTIQ